MDDIKAGAVHRMMNTNPPSGDSPGIVWTTWEPPAPIPNSSGSTP